MGATQVAIAAHEIRASAAETSDRDLRRSYVAVAPVALEAHTPSGRYNARLFNRSGSTEVP
ncbi:MAG TPA: hypothetical protein PKK97_08490, partial [Thauera aminoaromatica]|nr:hypothetical protein [Thauera aminoaromatica]